MPIILEAIETNSKMKRAVTTKTMKQHIFFDK
jgi:hypothetical protein